MRHIKASDHNIPSTDNINAMLSGEAKKTKKASFNHWSWIIPLSIAINIIFIPPIIYVLICEVIK